MQPCESSSRLAFLLVRLPATRRRPGSRAAFRFLACVAALVVTSGDFRPARVFAAAADDAYNTLYDILMIRQARDGAIYGKKV